MSKAQEKLLTQWDLIIVDPFRNGTKDAVSESRNVQFLGRIDLNKKIMTDDDNEKALDRIADSLMDAFRGTDYAGVLLAGWEDRFNPAVFNELIYLVDALGLKVFLETRPPNFLQDGKLLRNAAISGLVVCNASIMPNGNKRDYFDVMSLQPTIKAFVTESCMRDFLTLAWETVDDNVSISNAVLKRSIQWCGFYSALTWIGTKESLQDASLNTATEEPLGAFEWLKEDRVMKIHELWRNNTSIATTTNHDTAWKTLVSMFHSVPRLLHSEQANDTTMQQKIFNVQEPSEWSDQASHEENPLSISTSGKEINSLGCFPLGVDADPLSFAEILQSQRHLKDLGLLHPVMLEKLQKIASLLRAFNEEIVAEMYRSDVSIPNAVQEMVAFASNSFLKVHLGLDSGFKKSADKRYWAVFESDLDSVDIYVSKNAHGLAATILHTFLSSRGIPRHKCFEVEYALAEWSRDLVISTGLPRRLHQDIEMQSPAEALLFVQHLHLSDKEDSHTERIQAAVKSQLIDKPAMAQLRETSTFGYLSGNVSAAELVQNRVEWYHEQKCRSPELFRALTLFHEVESHLTYVLKSRQEDQLKQITEALARIIVKGRIDAYADILGLAFFSAARKAAFDEVYTSVTDRNPLFNDQSDQAAAFAESFALGSRCEAYFGVVPSAFGKLLSDRFRTHYDKHQPPDWTNGAPALATSYAGAQIDCDLEDKVTPLPAFQRFTFLSVFAIPALLDILLLSTTGRGLYLTAFMTLEEQQSATTALMIALLLSGAVGTWIAVGGSYYLTSMAFSAMNLFVLTRFLAGMAFVTIGGIIGFIVMAAAKNVYAAIIFFLYLFALTAYLTLFAAVASFQYPGSAFLSGRSIILCCLPVLWLSPIITMWSGHDIVVYLIVIYFFLGLLVFGLRHVGMKWVTWYQALRRTDDSEIRKWYIESKAQSNEKVLGTLSDPAALRLARETLFEAVLDERFKSIFKRRTKDTLIHDLARDWDSTNFLMDWYCRYADVPRPMAFSSAWNTQTKVALDVLCNNQKGIRLHSAFIHWRQAGDEVGCGTLFFIVASTGQVDRDSCWWTIDRTFRLSQQCLSDGRRFRLGLLPCRCSAHRHEGRRTCIISLPMRIPRELRLQVKSASIRRLKCAIEEECIGQRWASSVSGMSGAWPSPLYFFGYFRAL